MKLLKILESEGLSIKESYRDEMTIFTISGLSKFNYENKNRVKTRIEFQMKCLLFAFK